MNSSHQVSTSVGLPHDRFAVPTYRVCRLSVDGEINRRIAATDSPEIAVLDFLKVTALHRGENLYVWDREQKRIVAQVEWVDEPTAFGTTLKVRRNQFYEQTFVEIARRLCMKDEIRHAIVQGVAM